MAGATKKRNAIPLWLDPLPFKKLRHITAEGAEESCREPSRDGALGAVLARLPFQADGSAVSPAPGGTTHGATEDGSAHQWMVQLAEQLAAAQEELNIMLDVINQVEAGTLVSVENVQRPKPTLLEHKDDIAKRVGVKQAATQSAHGRLQSVAQRIRTRVDTDQIFYDGLRRLQSDWKVKRLVSHGRVRFLVDLSLPPPLPTALRPLPARLPLRSSLTEREQAATQLEVRRGKDGHLTAVPEIHRPLWEFAVGIIEDGNEVDISGDGNSVHEESGIMSMYRDGEPGAGSGDVIDGVHARLHRMQSSLLAEAVFDIFLTEAVSHPPSGALVVRASISEVELSLTHGQRLCLYLRPSSARNSTHAWPQGMSQKAANARAFLMEHFVEMRYGGPGAGLLEATKGEPNAEKSSGLRVGHVNGGVAERVGGLALLCLLLQQEHGRSIVQRQVAQAVRAIPGAHCRACAPSPLCSQPSGWWVAVHVAGCQVATLGGDGGRWQMRGQAGAAHHGDISCAYVGAYVQDEIARYQVRRVYETAIERQLAAETRGLLTVVVVAPLGNEKELEGWVDLHNAVCADSGAMRHAVEWERAELWVGATPSSSSGGIDWSVRIQMQRKGWRGNREGLTGQDVPLDVGDKMLGGGTLKQFLTVLTTMFKTGRL